MEYLYKYIYTCKNNYTYTYQSNKLEQDFIIDSLKNYKIYGKQLLLFDTQNFKRYLYKLKDKKLEYSEISYEESLKYS